jgi:ribosomal protein L37AE/L43A
MNSLTVPPNSRRAWIVISKNPDSTVRADDGYLETIGESYEWVSKLPHGNDISVGDLLLVRDSEFLLGFSIIDQIDVYSKIREKSTCPKCGVAQVRVRKTVLPMYLCAGCNHTFESPNIEKQMLEHKVASYGAGWVDLGRNSKTLKAWKILSLTPKSQHSLQPVDIEAFLNFTSQFSKLELARFRARDKEIKGGHKLRTVKTRIGQSAFRESLLNKFGPVCAFTGDNHPAGLEAAHLYSYSLLGTHHSNGGLLLRRDIHSLFDNGLIAFNVESKKLDLASDLLKISQYKPLQGAEIKVEVSDQVKVWLEIHWNQYR